MRGDPNIPTCGFHSDVQEPTRRLYEHEIRSVEPYVVAVACEETAPRELQVQRLNLISCRNSGSEKSRSISSDE